MKRAAAVIVASALLVGLTGCTVTKGDGNGGATSVASPTAGVVSEGALPTVTRLAAGTLKLEGAHLAVGAEQAAALLPLWKAYLALSRNDSAAQAEVEALVAQIEETMSPEQRQAIADMQLTAEDVAALMQELGISAMGSARTGAATGETTRRQGAFAGGGGPMGGFAGGAGGMPAMAPEMMPGRQGEGLERGAGQAGAMRAAVATPLIEALVKVLESRA